MTKMREIAKFLSGFETFHAILHGYLFVSKTTLVIFGVSTTPTLNLTSLLINAILAALLGWYGWRKI